MRIDDSAVRYETEALGNMKRMQQMAAQIIETKHPSSEVIREAAAHGPLVSASQEMKMQGLMSGSVSKGTLADEMRALLGLQDGQSEVGMRTHADGMQASSAARYASLVESMKQLLQEQADPLNDPLTSFQIDDEDEELDIDEELGSTVRTSELQSEVDFLRAQIKDLTAQYAAERASKENKFSTRGGTQTNRYGIGA